MGENIYKKNRKRQINSFSLLDKYVLLFWNKFYIIMRDLRQRAEFYQIRGVYIIKKKDPTILDGIGIKARFLDIDKRYKYVRIKRILIIRIKKRNFILVNANGTSAKPQFQNI